MSINYDSIKASLTPEQRAYLEGKKKSPRKKKPEVMPTVVAQTGTSAPSAGWVNCEYGCIGRTNGPDECDLCGGKMVPGPSSGLTPSQLKKK